MFRGGVKHIEALIRASKKRIELGINNNDFVIISVGELNNNKNHEVIIEAIAELSNPYIKYLICGQGELETYLIHKIKQYNLQRQVMVLGYRTDIKELLTMSDLFAFPSKREGLSVSLMEAMACGLPIICYTIRGNVDLLKINGSECKVKNTIKYWTVNIKKMLGLQIESRLQLGIENSTKVKEFSIQNVMGKMGIIYKKM